MKKFLIIAAVVLGIGTFVIARNPVMRSYCSAVWHTCQAQVKGNVTPEFEIERLKLEIAKLDQEIPNLVNDLAVMDQDEIQPLNARVTASQKNLKAREQTLLEFAKVVKSNPSSDFEFAKVKYTSARANDKLAEDFAWYQSLKAQVQGQEKLLAAKQQQYKIKYDQVTKIRQTKEGFELKLTQLETDLALVRAEEATGNGVTEAKFDNSRITLIQDGLKNLQRQVNIMKKKTELLHEIAPAPGTPTSAAPKLDPDVVLQAIQHPAAEKSNVQTVSPEQ
jgi:hypothetical protein